MIQRKTDKRLPRYRDGLEEDVFMFSGAEDLVPFLKDDGTGNFLPVEKEDNGYNIKRYRPRIEGGFARIEKIHHVNHGVYWKVTTRENIATIFGRSPNARIANPEDETQIFQWMPEFSFDDKGNWIKYEYKEENLINVPNEVYEKNRINSIAPFTNVYLKSIKYGNRKAYYADSTKPYDPQAPADNEHFFELVMDYGQYDELNPTPQDDDDNAKWDYRPDAYSFYRSGFEIRTNRLCKRILMFHHFKDNSIRQWDGTAFGENYLIRSLDLEYEPAIINNQPSIFNINGENKPTEVSYLKSITQSGYIRYEDGGNLKYSKKSLPPIEFTYEKLNWNKVIKTVSPENIINAPVGLTNNYQWVDLYGEGISGILTEQGEGWFYKNNLGDVDEDGDVAFTIAKKVIPKPSFTGLSNGVLSVQDIAANGEKQVVVSSNEVKGYFELTFDNDWKPFQPFEQIANIDLQDPNTRLIDLNGDGQPEIVMTEENVFTWYAADGKRGHLPSEQTIKAFDEEQGPAIVFADQEQTIFLADMSGDGLTDIVRIRNGEVCYWANKGYGKFSAKVTMGNAPLFDNPDLFNSQYLHLADVSGTGATDIIYLGKNKFKAFINLSGNAWSDAHEIEPFFPVDRNSQLSVVDLLGTGTSCIVWSSDLPAYVNAPMRYIDLMDSKKPHVLIHHKNNFGKETSIQYKSSTHYYLKDKLNGKPWITKLPFPVQVVSKLVVEEKITEVRFTSEYKYHHGYYDHPEREFRGFGMVEQIDTEHYDTYKEQAQGNAQTSDYTLYQPPVLTKTWFHTGAFLDRERILTHFENEYWHKAFYENFDEPSTPDARLDSKVRDLVGDEFREALRACKGMVLRQEVFALDVPEENPTQEQIKLEKKPYTVASHNCNVQLLQPRDKNEFGVFLVTESEAITIHYERDETDYRLAHTLNTRFDNLGNVLESASVVYGRNQLKAKADFETLSDNITDFSEDVLDDDASQKTQLLNAFTTNIQAAKDEQTKTHIIFTQNSFAKFRFEAKDYEDIDLQKLPNVYRTRLPYETKTYEITGLKPADDVLFTLDELITEENKTIFTDDANYPVFEYHQDASGTKGKRLIEHVKTRYLKDDLTHHDFEYFDTLALPFENYQLAYTPDLLTDIYGNKLPNNQNDLDKLMGQEIDSNDDSECKFLKGDDGFWWIRSGFTHFKEDAENLDDVKDRFYSPIKFEDPFGAITKVKYDSQFLFIKETEDAIGNKMVVDIFNYRTLSPNRMIDLNANPSTVLLDELGLVKAMAVEGNGDFDDTNGYSLADADKADDFDGLKEYTDDAEKTIIDEFFGSATSESTDTATLRTKGNDLLQHASVRFAYDFDVYKKIADENEQFIANGEPEKVKPLKPVVVASIFREEHHNVDKNKPLADRKFQFSFEYSDGLGNVAMTKVQAEPGVACYIDAAGNKQEKNTGSDLRWVGNGRTILNNKGNPVKQYEPYFSTNFLYENESALVECGVTPILYYDALGRLVKTTFPDGTLSKVEFDSWKQLSFDQNDTVEESECLWYLRRTDNTRPDYINDTKEQRAASEAQKHANTPSSLYLDSLGRPVLSVANNGKDAADEDKLYTTFIKLDIEGNVRVVTDARNNPVMLYGFRKVPNDSSSPMIWGYDMLGHRVYQNSMDAGERWVLNNVMGNSVLNWDAKNQEFATKYDKLQRPTEVLLGDAVIEKKVYGETNNDFKNNLNGQVIEHFDSSGKMTNESFDFKGNLLSIERQLAADFDKEIIEWSASPPTSLLEAEIFKKQTEYDALNRMERSFNWHQDDNRVTVYIPIYNARKLLLSEQHITDANRADIDNTGRGITAVSNIEYNEKGQRTRMRLGNGTTTRYYYDSQTFRLAQLRTTRNAIDTELPTSPSNLTDAHVLQNLYYTYDPIGNITEIEDDAFEPEFFGNQQVEPKSRYVYDPIYRLTQAEGRENKSFDNAPTANQHSSINATFPINNSTLRNYTQTYQYDPVGNILKMRHRLNGAATADRWTRSYAYATESNQLKSTRIGSNPTNAINYQYDEHGNMLNYHNTPQEYRPDWDYRDMVYHLNLGGGGEAYYQYGTDRERTRKRVIKSNISEERLYLGGMEIYRRWRNGNLEEVIETHHLFIGQQRILLVENVLQTNNASLSTGILDRYQYSNHLGSVGLELNGDGAIISYEEYHPYGTTAYRAMDKSITVIVNRYRYTGMEQDDESGLGYHSARYYMHWIGRWLNVDPIGIEGGVNTYRYSYCNPIKYRDKTGLQPDSEDYPEALRTAWNEAEADNYSDESIERLKGVIDETYTSGTRQHMLEYAAVNATAGVRNWERGNYVRGVVQQGAAVVESIGIGFGLFGESRAGTAARMSTAGASRYFGGRLLNRLSRGRTTPSTPPPTGGGTPPSTGGGGAPRPTGGSTPPSTGGGGTPRPTGGSTPPSTGGGGTPRPTSGSTPPSTGGGGTPRPTGGSTPPATGGGTPRPSIPQVNPQELARQLIATHGGSVRAIIPHINQAGLGQQQAAQVLTEVFRQTGRNIGGVKYHGQNLLLLSRRVGTSQPINVISPTGQVSFGTADIVLEGPNIVARNISY